MRKDKHGGKGARTNKFNLSAFAVSSDLQPQRDDISPLRESKRGQTAYKNFS